MLGAEHAFVNPRFEGPRHQQLTGLDGALVSEAKILRGQLDPEVEAALDRHEAAVQPTTRSTSPPSRCTTTSTSVESCQILLKVLRTTELLDEDPTVYNVMNGPTSSFASEHCATGASSTMSQNHSADVARLGPIRRGDARHRAAVLRTTFRTCAGRSSKLEPHALRREPERYLDVVEGFLANYDQ